MATVGQVLKTKDGKNAIDLHLPFCNKERLYIRGNKDKTQNNKQPDFNVFGLYGKVGGVWNTVSQDGKTAYKTMSIESPHGVLRFAIFNAKEEKETDKGTVTHTVAYSTPKPQDNFSQNPADNNNQDNSSYNEPQGNNNYIPEIDIDEDEIPF